MARQLETVVVARPDRSYREKSLGGLPGSIIAQSEAWRLYIFDPKLVALNWAGEIA